MTTWADEYLTLLEDCEKRSERRLRQMAAKREKDAKRAARKAAETKVPA